MPSFKRYSISAGAMAAVLAAAGPAWAQTEGSKPAEPAGLQDIVVTAQKRAQNVQSIPIAIAAVTGAQLAKSGVTTTQDFSTAFAGVNIKTTSSQLQPSIRGLGTSTSNVENAVAMYIDGVYYANQSDARRDLNDIDQVAVLKGPQGTLFGRNATAGVIQITTRAPSFNFNGNVQTSIDNYATWHANAYVTGPVSEKLAYSLSANYATQGKGWGKNYTTGNDTYKIYHNAAVRGKLLFRPDENTDITLIGDYTDRSDNLGAYFRAYPGTSVNPKVPYVQPATVYDSYNNVESLNLYQGGGASMTVEHHFGFGKFQSISAYRQFRTGYIIDADMTSVTGHRLDTSHNKAMSFSQELQLTSEGSKKLNWAFGLYYFHYVNKLDPMHRDFGGPLYVTSPASYVTRDLTSKETVDSLAPYAQADYEILPETRLTLGARWTYEKRTLDASWPSTRADGTVVANSIPAVNGASITAQKPSWRVALDHKFSADVLGYVSYNRGFKSGGFNIANPANPAYQPEQLDAYEAGLKTTFLDHKLRLNLAGFYYKYQNLQVLQLSAAAPIITNGAGAELYGVDADFEARITPSLRVSGSVEALHAAFTSYPGAVISYQVPTGGIATTFGDVSGNRLPLSQKFSANAVIDYDRELGAYALNLNAAVAYNGSYVFDPDNVVKQGAYTNINLGANLTLPGGKVTLGLFMRNALDNKIISYSTASSPLGYITTYDNPPRTFGASVRAKF